MTETMTDVQAAVLDALRTEKTPPQVARELGLPKAAVTVALVALRGRGYVYPGYARGYRSSDAGQIALSHHRGNDANLTTEETVVLGWVFTSQDLRYDYIPAATVKEVADRLGVAPDKVWAALLSLAQRTLLTFIYFTAEAAGDVRVEYIRLTPAGRAAATATSR